MTRDVSALTLEQKASLLSGRDFWSTKPIDSAGIPSIILSDGPHGLRYQGGNADHLGINDSLQATCFPLAVAVGSSWDPKIATLIGAAVGREARALGVSIVLGPGVNIKRSPLCGRNFEYYSEDPLLSGVLGAAHVTGLQGEGVGAAVKHFVANNQETQRMQISAEIDERTLREIYLPAFERIVTEARPSTVMCAYNRVNGVYASQNEWLLTDLLRHEWGFAGAVVSDWGAVSDRVEALTAGLDLEMPGNGGVTDQKIVEAVYRGELDGVVVDKAARRVLALTELPHDALNNLDVDAHHQLARQLAADCVVLLKNESGALPVSSADRIGIIGGFATAPRYQGAGSSHINPTRLDIPLDAIRDLAPLVEYAEGFATDGSGDADSLRQEAVELAARVDIAVIFAGLSEREESEGFDREHLELPADQIGLIRAVAEHAPRTVVVLANGGVVSLEGWHYDVDAIVEGWLLGQAAGGALADVLFGLVNPSGHLAESIPLRVQDNPSWMNFPGEQGHVRYGEGVLVGYRYYESAAVPVRYPFGHGLSYTTFRTDSLSIERVGDDRVIARVTVTNTGSRAGKHAVQVYVATNAGPVRRPLRELRAFTKVDLAPNETSTVELTLDRRAFAFWDVELGKWAVAGGEYSIQVGDDVSHIVAQTSLTVAGDVVVRELTLESTVGDWFSHPLVGSALAQGMAANMTEEQAASAASNPDGLKMVDSMPMRQFLAFTGDAFPPKAIEDLLALSRTAVSTVGAQPAQ